MPLLLIHGAAATAQHSSPSSQEMGFRQQLSQKGLEVGFSFTSEYFGKMCGVLDP